MLAAALQDLLWRKKRFVIALTATSLVFSMTLVMAGLSAAFPNEIGRLLDRLGGELYYAKAGSNGPFSAGGVVTADSAPAGSAAVLYSVATVRLDGDLKQVSLFGVDPTGTANPEVSSGRSLAASGELVVASSLVKRPGDTIVLGSIDLEVVGVIDDLTLFGGQGTVFLPLSDAQILVADGQDVASFFVGPATDDRSTSLAVFDRATAKDDLLRPLEGATGSIAFIGILLWIVAACIIGSVVFLSALERTRDFAVFKATGASTISIGIGLIAQAVVIAVFASAVAVVLAMVLAPVFPMPVEIPTSAMALLPVLAVVAGVLSSLIGLRRAVSVPPALAFGAAA
ncbi:MAG: ABC transporter permease [Actinobacteria bacterium]|nr:ABC transporter permease [Actinomycetota bacterium]